MPCAAPEQHLDFQVDALTAAGCYRVFTDTASGAVGALAARPELDRVLDQLRPGDTLVVVWKLDRLGPSLRHLVDTVTMLADRGLGFRGLQEALDTTMAGGKLVFHIFAALAEFERDLIRERTRAGLAAARARGRHGGRPSVMTPDKVGCSRAVRVLAIHRRSHRKDPRRQPCLDLPPPPRRRCGPSRWR